MTCERKFARIEHVLIMKVYFERRKIANVFMTHVQDSFRKSLLTDTFERKLFDVSCASVLQTCEVVPRSSLTMTALRNHVSRHSTPLICHCCEEDGDSARDSCVAGTILSATVDCHNYWPSVIVEFQGPTFVTYASAASEDDVSHGQSFIVDNVSFCW